MMRTIYVLLIGITMFSCRSIPKGAVAVTPFQIEKYLGTWYEIARIDFAFERGLNNTTANYTMLPNGYVKVTNRGYNPDKQKWKEAVGKAKFRGSDTLGELKVSFLGPFYSGYNVIALAGDYEYALVAGKNNDYLWILSRTPSIPENIKEDFLVQAKKVGYDTSKLIWVSQDMAQ